MSTFNEQDVFVRDYDRFRNDEWEHVREHWRSRPKR